MLSVDWHDARAYCAWLSRRLELPAGLPTEQEYEKAARGVDGRHTPWGGANDPSLARTKDSRAGAPTAPRLGEYSTDCSVYGVRDVVGTIREWCADLEFDGAPELRPVRSSCWLSAGTWVDACIRRFGFPPRALHSYIGFRPVLRPADHR